MIIPIIVPKLGMSTSEDVTVVKWIKSDGQPVEKGEPVVVIETAKVTYEIEAQASGTVFKIKKVRDKVKIGEPIGVVADSREEFEAYLDTLAKEPEVKELEVTAGILFEEEADETEGIRLSFEEEEDETEGIRLSFEAEEEEEIPLVAPTIEVGDRVVLNRIPFMGMRRTIADNLMASLRTGAQLTVVNEVDMTELAHFRKELMLDDLGEKVTFVDMLVKLLASVLKEFPIVNSTVAGDEIICWGEYHIGVAVALEDGLVVPVVRNADQKSLLAVSREIKKLSRKARRGMLNPDHYQGGTFTLSSGGKADVEFMTPIINPPQNAILGIGKIGPRPAVHQGQLTIRTTTYLCLTHDHRIIDGAPAGMFLGRLKEVIEHPMQFQKILK